jgi:hypothetical protein
MLLVSSNSLPSLFATNPKIYSSISSCSRISSGVWARCFPAGFYLNLSTRYSPVLRLIFTHGRRARIDGKDAGSWPDLLLLWIYNRSSVLWIGATLQPVLSCQIHVPPPHALRAVPRDGGSASETWTITGQTFGSSPSSIPAKSRSWWHARQPR